MITNNNELSEQEIEMINSSLLCVIPELSKLSSISMSTVNGQMKFVCDGGKNVLDIPNSFKTDKTTSDRDMEMRILSSAGNRMSLTSEASIVPSPIFSCISSDISYSNDQTGSGISVSNHKKTIRSNTSNEEHLTDRLQAEGLQILSSLDVPNQNFLSFNDKGTGNVRPKRKSMNRDFADSHLQSNEKHTLSLVSLGFDRLVSDSDIFTSSSVAGSQVMNPAQTQRLDMIKGSNPSLSAPIRIDIPNEMPSCLDAGNILPGINRDNQSASEGIQSSLMSLAQTDAALTETESFNVNLINEISDVVQSKSICTEEYFNNEDVSVKLISSKSDVEVIEHLGQPSVGDFQLRSPLISARNVEVDQQSGCGFASSVDDVLRSANEILLIPSQGNVSEKTTADLQSNSNKNISCFMAVPCEKTISDDLCTSKNSLLLDAVVVGSSQSQETFRPKLTASQHELSGASTVQRYMAASVLFLGGAGSPGDDSLLPSPQGKFLGDIRYSLLQGATQLRSESVNVDALFPKGRSLHRTFSSPKNHRKLNNQESPLLNVTEDLGLEEFSDPINKEKLSFETEDGSFDSCVDALFRRPRICQKSSNGRKRKLFFTSEQLFSDKPEKKFKSGMSASIDRRAVKEDDSFCECPADDDSRLMHCTDSYYEAPGLCSDNVFTESIQNDKNNTKYDQRFKIYGCMIRGIHQQRKDCKKATDLEVRPKESENSSKDESRIDGTAGFCEKHLREEKDLDLATEIKNSPICLSLAKNNIPFKDNSPHKINLNECQKSLAGRRNTQKKLLSKQNFSLAFKSHILKTPAVAAFLLSQNSGLQGENDQWNHQKQKSSLMSNVKESIAEGHGVELNSDRLRSRSRRQRSKSSASSLTLTGQFISSCDEKYETQNTDFSTNSLASSEYEANLVADCDIDHPAKHKDKVIWDKRHKLKQNASICSRTESRIVKKRISDRLCYEQSSNSEFVKQLELCRSSSSDVKVSLSSVVHQKRSERKTTVNLGLSAAVNPSHNSNLPCVQFSDALKTKAQEKSSAGSCSKTPLREKTTSNQLFCNDYAHVKKMKELLKREVGSSREITNVCLKGTKF